MKADTRDVAFLVRELLGTHGPMDLWQLRSLLGCSRAEARLALSCLAARGEVSQFEQGERLCFRLLAARGPAVQAPSGAGARGS